MKTSSSNPHLSSKSTAVFAVIDGLNLLFYIKINLAFISKSQGFNDESNRISNPYNS